MNAIEVLDSMCAEVARQHENTPLAAPEREETETSATGENRQTKKSNKRLSSPSGSKRPSKKAARQQEEAAAAAAKAEARQHEINMARAKRPDAEILVKDCTVNLICRDSGCESLKSAVINAASAMKTSE